MINAVEDPSNLSELFRVRLDNKSDTSECPNHIIAIQVAPPEFAARSCPYAPLGCVALRGFLLGDIQALPSIELSS